jgi:mycoredoxin
VHDPDTARRAVSRLARRSEDARGPNNGADPAVRPLPWVVMGSTMRRWAPAAALAVAAAAVAAVHGVLGEPGSAVGWGAALLVAAVLVSPLLFPGDSGLPRDATIYWKPGCSFCVLMRLGLVGVAGRARWVDVSRDEVGAAAVREHNDGDLTTPTVVTPDGPRTNPSVSWVRGRLAP